jgi:serine/threonine-protein phosphatase 2A activator
MDPPQSVAPATTSFPTLEILNRSAPHRFLRPAKRINVGTDVDHFLTSKAYRDIGIFVLQLNRALIPRKHGSRLETFPLTALRTDPEPVLRLQELLRKTEAIIDDAPLDQGPRRFGNIGFRTFHTLLEQRADGLLQEFFPEGTLDGFSHGDQQEGDEPATGPMDEIKAYFLGGFGSSQRLDYGTGHELSFLAFLGCLWKLGYFPAQPEGETPGAIERSIVLGVLEPYLKVIRRLILHYSLEPAGSHGVWGLDDHSFLPYIFGSAQLSRPLTSESEPTPLEGSSPGAPRPSDAAKAELAENHRASWTYFSAVAFINDVKKGPFWEHSPILFDISGIRDGWGKINKGMIKMFNAEVLSKFPVVQHFPFGSLFSWDVDPTAQAPVKSVHMASQPAPSVPGGPTGVGTAAPWANATRMPGPAGQQPGIPYSKAPWAGAPPPPRGGAPDTGPPPPAAFPRGVPGTASNQHSVTKAPWAK